MVEKTYTICRDNEGVGYTEDTLFKVFRILRGVLDAEDSASECINALQNAGILFRERFDVPKAAPWSHKPGYRIRNRAGSSMFRGVCEYCTALWVEDSSEEYVRAQLNRHIELNHADKLPAVPAVPLFKLKCPNCPDSVGGQTFEETHVALGVHIRFAHSEKES